MVEDALRFPGEMGEGLRGVCIREVQKDLTQSAKALIEAKIHEFGLGTASGFRVLNDAIETPGDGVLIFKGMNQYTAESVKSLENFHRAWWEEAHTAGQTSLDLLRPTIRAHGSELWFSWNRRHKRDVVDKLLTGGSPPTRTTVVQANWRDNPWFPPELEQERQDCEANEAEKYDHIWEGDYATVNEGAYFASHLAKAKREDRIGFFPADDLMPVRAFFDIGGTGRKADATAIWIAQFIGAEIRVLDYYEAVRQPLSAHLNWMRSRGYQPDTTTIWLPHDGAQGEKVIDTSYESAVRAAGYEVMVIPNQGTGAALNRVDVARRHFNRIRFNEATTGGGREALGWYHEKIDEQRNIGLGPEHDWSSHGADAFGLMCLVYEEAPVKPKPLPQVEDTSWAV